METKKRKRSSTRFGVMYGILLGILVLYTLSLIILLFWTLITSLKEPLAYSSAYRQHDLGKLIGFGDMTFSNYAYAFENFIVTINSTGATINIIGMFGNSLIYAVGCALLATFTPCIVSYLCARYHYKFGKFVYTIVLVVMALPVVGSLPSEITMVKNIGLFDSIFGLYILKANFLGIYFLVFFANFKGIPYEYTEAAAIDGASELRIMVQVIFPLASSTILTVFILTFINFWNDYQTPMIYWNSYPVAAYGMWEFNRATAGMTGRVPIKLAGIIIMALPILAVYAVFHNRLAANLSVGGVKG